jgi:hypothetical protein
MDYNTFNGLEFRIYLEFIWNLSFGICCFNLILKPKGNQITNSIFLSEWYNLVLHFKSHRQIMRTVYAVRNANAIRPIRTNINIHFF